MTVVAVATAAVSLLLTGVVAGLFATFSVAVMPALDAVPPGQAVAVMRSINRKIVNPVFLAAFLGAPLTTAVTGALVWAEGHPQAGAVFLTGAAVLLLGVLAPTVAVNVPMNEALDAAPAPDDRLDDRVAAREWAGYSPRWTRWNTLRAASGSTALLLVGLGLVWWGRQ